MDIAGADKTPGMCSLVPLNGVGVQQAYKLNAADIIKAAQYRNRVPVFILCLSYIGMPLICRNHALCRIGPVGTLHYPIDTHYRPVVEQ